MKGKSKVNTNGGSKVVFGPAVAEYLPREFRVESLRECPMPETRQEITTPKEAAAYWCKHVATDARFNGDVESLVVLVLDVHRRRKGHYLASTGTLDTVVCHCRELFRIAILTAGAAVVVMHNHPSGIPTPSEADIKFTARAVKAGQVIQIDVLDHVIMGWKDRHSSMRQLGYITDDASAPVKGKATRAPISSKNRLKRNGGAA
jgi:DNA repair protein RadC